TADHDRQGPADDLENPGPRLPPDRRHVQHPWQLPVEVRPGDRLEPHAVEDRGDGRGLPGHPVPVFDVGGELVVVQADLAVGRGDPGPAAHRRPPHLVGGPLHRHRLRRQPISGDAHARQLRVVGQQDSHANTAPAPTRRLSCRSCSRRLIRTTSRIPSPRSRCSSSTCGPTMRSSRSSGMTASPCPASATRTIRPPGVAGTMPPCASLGMFGVLSVNPPTLPSPGMFTPGSVNDRLFHLSMIQLIADRNACLIPSHMPDAAERIFPGRPLTKSTILVNRSTIQSRTSPIQPLTLSKTSFHDAKYCLIFSHSHLAISPTLLNAGTVTFFHHHSTAPATTSNAFLIPSHAGLIA